MNWYLMAVKKYTDFSGRACRQEYWFFVLINCLFAIVATFIDRFLGFYDYHNGIGLLSGIYGLMIFLPSLAVAARRLHDTDRSGWWLLLLLMPVIGVLVLFVFMVLPSHAGRNRYDNTIIEE